MSQAGSKLRNQVDEAIGEDLITKICKQQSELIFKELDERFNKIEQSLNTFISQVKTNTHKIGDMEKLMDTNEQYSRLNNLRIYGIKESENENSGVAEDMLLQLFKNKLNIDISPNDIDRCHRVGGYKRGKSRPILVRFMSYKMRSEIFRNKKLLKNTGFVIKEDLTQGRLELVKNVTDKYGIKNVWTQSGRVFVLSGNQKKIIDSVKDL